jgi:CYTH domain-containing protein
MQIPYDLAETLMANQKVMTKVRHRVYHKNYMVEVDSFADDAINAHLGGYMIAEIEFPDIESANKFTAPSFFGKEVTADKKRYSNAAMFKLL